MATSIGGITIDFLLNLAGFRADLPKAQKEAEKGASGIAKAFSGIAKGFDGAGASIKEFAKGFVSIEGALGGLAAGASIVGIAQAFYSAADAAGALNDQANNLGIGVETLEALNFSAVKAGVGTEELSTALIKLNEALGRNHEGDKAAVQAFEDIGIAADLNSGKITDVGQAFIAISDKLSTYSSTSEAAAKASEVFGAKLGPKMVGYLTGAAGSITDLMQQARDLGLVLSKETVDGADAAGDKLETLGFVLKADLTRVLVQLAPQISSFADSLVQATPKIEEFGQKIAAAFQWMFDHRRLLVDLFALLAGAQLGAPLGPAGAAIGAGIALIGAELGQASAAAVGFGAALSTALAAPGADIAATEREIAGLKAQLQGYANIDYQRLMAAGMSGYAQQLGDDAAAVATRLQGAQDRLAKLKAAAATKPADTPKANLGAGTPPATPKKGKTDEQYRDEHDRFVDAASAAETYRRRLVEIEDEKTKLAKTGSPVTPAEEAFLKDDAARDYAKALDEQRAAILGTTGALGEYHTRLADITKAEREAAADPKLGLTGEQFTSARSAALTGYLASLRDLRGTVLGVSDASKAYHDRLEEIADAQRQLKGTGRELSDKQVVEAQDKATAQYLLDIQKEHDTVLGLSSSYTDLAQQIADVNAKQAEGVITAEEANRRRQQLTDPSLYDVYQAGQTRYDTPLDERVATDPLAGMVDALSRYADSAQQYGKIAGDALATGLDGATDMLMNYFATGKTGWKEQLAAIDKFIERLLIQQFIMQIISGISGVFAPTTPTGNTAATAGQGNAGRRGFAQGGSMLVLGQGGRDKNEISFMASRGETIHVVPPGVKAAHQAAVERGPMLVNAGSDFQLIDQRGANAPPIERQERIGPDGRRQWSALIRAEMIGQVMSGDLDKALTSRLNTSPRTR